MTDTDTSGLRGFAVWARVALIGEVAGRVAAVLAPGSVQRVEQPMAVGALERAVATAGGGEAGRAAVVDAVAYTWFNRIIALRFMDANGYTGVGVVSPQAGVTVGQPEILADAKRGVLDAQVVGSRTQQTVMALLDGTRHGPDPQGEAYGLLLAEYCRFWHQVMPFLFEPEGDFTELLMPANLLADDSVLNRAVSVLTAEVCADVEVIGWLYQFYVSERKDEVFAGFKKNIKAGPAEIPAATQLFTPHWIVRYLVENSLGRLWMLNHPDSRLVEQMDYYIPPVDAETDFLKISTPEVIRIIDPACGSGHMLTYAFDLLYAIYEETGYAPSEIPALILRHNLYGTEIDHRAGSLAAFALTMKARQRQRNFLTKDTQPNICVIEPISFTDDELDYLFTTHGDRTEEKAFWNQFRDADLLGSLIQPDPRLTSHLARQLETLDDTDDLLNADTLQRAHAVIRQAEYLQPRYTIAIANPPYMGARNMRAAMRDSLEQAYPDGRSDLYAAFIIRSLNFMATGGFVAMITMQSWMFLKSYAPLRERTMKSGHLSSMLHLGARAFDTIGGEVVSTTAFVVSTGEGRRRGSFVRLVDLNSQRTKSEAVKLAINHPRSSSRLHYAAGDDFRQLPGGIIAYWLPDSWRALFAQSRSVAEMAAPRKGLDTGFNERFLRYWWEVGSGSTKFDCSDLESAEASGARWFPYNKGGEFRRWYGNHHFVVDWKWNGYEIRRFGTDLGGRPRSSVRNQSFYFLPSVAWSDVGGLAFRFYPEGFIHDNKGPSIFTPDPSTRSSLLGYLNSPLASELLAAIAPTMSTQVGDVGVLPFKRADNLNDLVGALVETSRSDWDSFETSWRFMNFPLADAGSGVSLSSRVVEHLRIWERTSSEQRARECKSNEAIASLYRVADQLETEVPLQRVSLSRNVRFTFGPDLPEGDYSARATTGLVRELVSYAVGCMFGRYSLDEPGLILSDQGATVQDYLAKVPAPRFMPDADNVLPVVDGDWFEDDILARFREFLREAFGEKDFEENLRFVTESLGVKDIRDYFVKSFYKDHVQRYKKRPIYWLFSSPKGSFNALIYMHRYTPTTVSTVLNEYLREFQAKVKASLDNAERSNNVKEADRLRKILVELEEYEHDVLYPLATQQIAIDLDDGVKANYPKLGIALKKIPGLETNQ